MEHIVLAGCKMELSGMQSTKRITNIDGDQGGGAFFMFQTVDGRIYKVGCYDVTAEYESFKEWGGTE